MKRFAILFVFLAAAIGAAALMSQSEASLRVTAVEGDDLAVDVWDGDGQPIFGANVSFSLPPDGTGATFEKTQLSVATVLTNRGGRAIAPPMRPRGSGRFDVQVRVEHMGNAASLTISRVNSVSLDAAARPFHIEILEGDDGINVIDKKSAVRPIVRVVDKNNLPVAGVGVTLAIVAMKVGGKGSFPSGKPTATATTDAAGRVVSPELTIANKGSFQIDVRLGGSDQADARMIRQTNYQTERAALDAKKIPGASHGDQQVSGELRVRVTNGSDAKNVVKGQKVIRPSVEVSDASGNPVSGAKVAFVGPEKGPSVRFASGRNYEIASTNGAGRAVAGEMRVAGKGEFQIQVLAAYNGAVAPLTTVVQTNFPTQSAAAKGEKSQAKSNGKSANPNGGGSSSTPLLLGLASAAAGVGGIVAAKQASSTSQSSTSQAVAANSCGLSLLNPIIADFQTIVNVCPASPNSGPCFNPRAGSCATACQKMINDFGPLCAACRTNLPSEFQQLVRDAGLTLPLNCR